MDYNATVAILAKTIIAMLLAVGGIVAIFKGVELYRVGVGLTPEKTSVEVFKKIKITTSSVGAILMVTASSWGWLATRTFQEYKGGGSEVAELSPFAITFAPTKAELDPNSQTELSKQVNWLKSNPTFDIAVGGVATEADGSVDAQMNIAGRRADNVKTYLVASGIDPQRISTFTTVNPNSTAYGGWLQLYSPGAVVCSCNVPTAMPWPRNEKK
jgi:OmpA family